MDLPVIGIVGGVGPYAGLEMNRKIFDNTLTNGTDRSHLEVILYSSGGRVTDRTEYLLGHEGRNPAEGLFEAVQTLARAGAQVAAIACNTAHSSEIITPLKEKIRKLGLRIELVDMIGEVGLFIKDNFGRGLNVGLLATEGTVAAGVYQCLEEERLGGTRLILPDREIVQAVHRAIYDTEFGIKAFSNPVTERAKEDCRRGLRHLKDKGAELVILGCTEIPLALPEKEFEHLTLIDPAVVAARALIRRVAPEKLKPMP
ncbi:MAG: amino acid racemase [Gemmatimonadota bacterium]|nr:amino acid racemase [Gemmatimonadota bacterium]